MIKPSEYVKIWKNESTMGVSFDMIEKAHTKKEYKNFCIWICGQTCGRGDNGKSYVYSWDYVRWLKEGLKTTQNLESWD